ncbi:MAG TPA: RagB/SusD family nutrient uptake outer membrane protein [Chitinophagaceae bacterium]|nr:RagB/SusD family nutrient uptake outer membrane protein [Chitinophagaceae bacterium]
MKNRCLYIVGMCSLLLFAGCEKQLQEQPYSQLVPGNFITSVSGITAVLYAAYAQEGELSGQKAVKGCIATQEWCTDLMWETSGSDNRIASQIIDFTWDASTPWFFSMLWAPPYAAIADANDVLDNIGNLKDATDAQKEGLTAEARFIRAISYEHLYSWFGPVPLRKSTSDTLQLTRATDDEMKAFIASELLAVIPELPDPGKEAAYGRANKGAAMGFLCKFYLNTRQWQKSADVAKQIMDLDYYQLFPDYEQLFHVENERNKEFMWVRQASNLGPGNVWMSSVYPPGFKEDPRTGQKLIGQNFGAQYRLLDGFYDSFDPKDTRQNLILTSYINTQGKLISLLNKDNTRSFKYWPDPNNQNNQGGNDIPELRYADILLARAEALNELNGPNAESIDLINKIRERAGLSDIALADFPSKEALRDHVLAERGWEFYSEGLRREDLLRMGKFIPGAVARGKNAKPFQKLFPIPLQAMDSNPELVQNTGY